MRELLQLIMSMAENGTMGGANSTALGAPAPESRDVALPPPLPSPAPKAYQPSTTLNANVAWSLAPGWHPSLPPTMLPSTLQH